MWSADAQTARALANATPNVLGRRGTPPRPVNRSALGSLADVIRKVLLDRVHGKLGEVDSADTRIGLRPSEEYGPVTQFYLCPFDAHRGSKRVDVSAPQCQYLSAPHPSPGRQE